MKFLRLDRALYELAVDLRLPEQARIKNGDDVLRRDHDVSAQVDIHQISGQRALPEPDLFHNILSEAPVEFSHVPGALRREVLRPWPRFSIDQQRPASQSLNARVGRGLGAGDLGPELLNERGVRGPFQAQRLCRGF